jgi:hypothetical protein
MNNSRKSVEKNEIQLEFYIHDAYNGIIKRLIELIVIFLPFLKPEMFQAHFFKNHESHSIIYLFSNN